MVLVAASGGCLNVRVLEKLQIEGDSAVKNEQEIIVPSLFKGPQ